MCVAAGLLALGLLAPVPLEATGRHPIIDVHVHAYSADRRFGTVVPNPLIATRMVASRDAESHYRDTHAAFGRYNVVKAVVSGGDHDAVLRWKQRDPARVIAGYAVIDPASVDLAFLRTEHAAGRLQVIGEVAPQYAGIPPTDPRLEPLFALAEELDVPVAYHMHPGPPGAPYVGMPKMRVGNGNPLLLEDVLVRHPRLRLYVMHAAWPMLDELLGVLYAHPQVYVDVAVINWSQPRPEFDRYLRRLVEAGYGKRIMFGSDQMVWPDMISRAVEAVDSANFLTAEQKRDIFYGNAARFLRLDAR